MSIMEVRGEEVLTLKQAAERIGVSAETLRVQARAGRLRATLAGRTYLVTASDLAAYDVQRKEPRGFAREDHPYHGKRGGGGRRKGSTVDKGEGGTDG